MHPTIFSDLDPEAVIMQEEIFGPVVGFTKVKDFEEGLKVANNTEYGLNSIIFTKDISRALTFAQRIQAGNVRVNTGSGMDANMPFGGFKSSGWGYENGREGIEAYTSLKSVAVKLS